MHRNRRPDALVPCRRHVRVPFPLPIHRSKCRHPRSQSGPHWSVAAQLSPANLGQLYLSLHHHSVDPGYYYSSAAAAVDDETSMLMLFHVIALPLFTSTIFFLFLLLYLFIFFCILWPLLCVPNGIYTLILEVPFTLRHMHGQKPKRLTCKEINWKLIDTREGMVIKLSFLITQTRATFFFWITCSIFSLAL